VVQIGARSGSKLDPLKRKEGEIYGGRKIKGGSDTNKAGLVRIRTRRELNSFEKIKNKRHRNSREVSRLMS